MVSASCCLYCSNAFHSRFTLFGSELVGFDRRQNLSDPTWLNRLVDGSKLFVSEFVESVGRRKLFGFKLVESVDRCELLDSKLVESVARCKLFGVI